MSSTAAMFASALRHHQAGNLARAEQVYRQILQRDPRNADALHLLGVIAFQAGRPEAAIELIVRAIQENPHKSEFHNNLGGAYQQAGRLDDAVQSFRKTLQIDPRNAKAHFDLGNAYRALQKLDEAVAAYQNALRIQPDYFQAQNNLSMTLKSQGKLREAIAGYEQSVRINPNYAGGHINLGVALKELGKLDEAVASFRRALELQPDSASAHNNLGNLFRQQGKLEDAVASYQEALRINSGYATAHYNLGNAWQVQGKLEEARTCYQRAIDIRPNYAEAHHNLGNVWLQQGRIDQALSSYQRALQIEPDFANAHSSMAHALRDQGRFRESIASYRRALQLKPGQTEVFAQQIHAQQQICEWHELAANASQLIESAGTERVSPFILLSLPSTPAQQQRCAENWAASFQHGAPTFNFTRPDKPRLTLGYLSADFHDHATAYLTAELFERHDRDRFQVYAYSMGPDDASPMRRRLVRTFDRFVDLRPLSFSEAAHKIHEDGVDILIDLKGYTRNARTEIVAMRPAPIQVNYLGYPGTMGADFVDYMIVDDFVVPDDQQHYFSEQLVYLPGCYQVNDRRRPVLDRTPSRIEVGLPEEGFIFCSFNQTYKITPALFSIWMRLLDQVPDSVLWLLESNPQAVVNLQREATSRGVDPARLVFAPKQPIADHLARIGNADLFLDSWPCNAHTTASDALWAGCPVITCAGSTFASRVAGSLLRALGLPELIASSPNEYEQLALKLARQPRSLQAIRQQLRTERDAAALFDVKRFTQHLEDAYRVMWEIYRAEQPPRSFAVAGAGRCLPCARD